MAEAAAGSGRKLPEAAGGHQPAPAPVHPPQQPRRKISLPWFRQSSFGIGTASKRLPKQHTIGGVTALGSDSGTAGDVQFSAYLESSELSE